jgi:hypothetical protein
LIAASTPTGTPISVAMMMAQRPSSTVAGNRAMNSVSTGFFVTSELPKSPCISRPRKSKYCITTGLSYPSCALSSACRSGVTPRSPAISSTGSPGRIRTKLKAMMVIPRKVGTR